MDVERDKQDRQSWDEFVSTGRFWVRKAGGRGGRGRGSNFDFDEVLGRNLGLLVEEEDFFRPSEKANGDEYEGFCNMGQGRYGEVGGGERLVDNRRRLAREGEKDGGGVSVQTERPAESLIRMAYSLRERRSPRDGDGGRKRRKEKGLSPRKGEGRG
jgi:hypothetical protein